LFTETVQLYIISFVSEKCVEIPVECMDLICHSTTLNLDCDSVLK